MRSYKKEQYGNDKLCDRNFSLGQKKQSYPSEVDRMCSDRELNSVDSDNVGEITGDNIGLNNIDRGLPMRSQYNQKKQMYDANKYLDFQLYDEKPPKKSKVEYNESNNYSSFADIDMSMTPITQQINPLYICNKSIEKFGSELFNHMFESLSENSFITCSVGLYTLFSYLYFASNNMTENELKRFFNFTKKEQLSNSLSKVINNDMTSMVDIKNLLIIGNNVPYNPTFCKSFAKFCLLQRVNIHNSEKESVKLNYQIDSLMGTKMRNTISPSNIINLQIMFLTVAVIRPIWTYSFDRVVKGVFTGYEQDKKQLYLLSMCKSYPYFEDNEHQLIEINCGGGELMFGILLHKNTQTNESNEKIHNYIEHAKNTVLDEIRIPIFSQDLKFRYNGILKNMGLKSVFHNLTADELFPEGGQLQDVVQNIKIIIGKDSLGKADNAKGYRSIRKFVADKPFFYYFRLTKTNTIIINGLYQ